MSTIEWLKKHNVNLAKIHGSAENLKFNPTYSSIAYIKAELEKNREKP